MSSWPTNSIMSPSKLPLLESAPLTPGAAIIFSYGPSLDARSSVNDTRASLRQLGLSKANSSTSGAGAGRHLAVVNSERGGMLMSSPGMTIRTSLRWADYWPARF
jgi:hypothetical protein